MDYWLEQIVELCLETETASRGLYLKFRKSCSSDTEREFWRRVEREESSHIAHWRQLQKKEHGDQLVNPFNDSPQTVQRLQQNLAIIQSLEQRTQCYDTAEALHTAMLAETFMLNPAFTVLFQFAEDEALRYPREAYATHVQQFVAFAEVIGGRFELMLLGQALNNMLDQSDEIADKMAAVRTLHGMIPICAWCKKVREDKGYWKKIEDYIEEHSFAEFSHGICPECKSNL